MVTGEACTVSADPVLLRQALQNLVDNAMKYSPLGAVIRVAVTTNKPEDRVAVMDEGPVIPENHRVKLANRFYRVEDSRVRGRGGFGLGLAITKAYMRVQGGRMDCQAGEAKGNCFSLYLPDAGGA